MQPSLRHMRMFQELMRTGSVTRTAELCHVSQPAVTQAIAKFERDFDQALFARTPQGLYPTEAGRMLDRRMRRALAFLNAATADMARTIRMRATQAQLRALVAVNELGNFTLAARRLGLAQPTVHRSVATLELAAGQKFFDRTAHGLIATRAARGLAQAAQLCFAELEQARADLAALSGREVGRIVIGSMPLSRSGLLPKTILRFRETHPDLPFEIIDGRYDELLRGLRWGEIDIIVGALRLPSPISDIAQERLFDDSVAIVARHGHPLCDAGVPDLAALARYPWVMPRKLTPIRAILDEFLGAAAPGNIPGNIIETSSLIAMREILRNSDHLGGVSRMQAEASGEAQSLAILPVEVANSLRPIGIATRADWEPTRAQSAFIEMLREVGGGLG